MPPQIKRLIDLLVLNAYGISVHSHWMAYAACELLERRAADARVLVPYLTKLIEEIVSNHAYRNRRQSTPIACRSEALLKFVSLARSGTPGASFPEKLTEEALHVADENLLLQLQNFSNGQFTKGHDDQTVQIDVVQHNGMSFLLRKMIY